MMIRILFLSILLLILNACAPPPDLTPLDSIGGVIVAKEVSDLPLDPDDTIWREAAVKEISLYPQKSVRPDSQQTDIQRVRIQALHNEEELALRLEWADKTPAEKRDIGQFVDGVAIQWPVNYGTGLSLPYVGMGHKDNPVALWFWRSDGNTETLAAEGFGTLTSQSSDGVQARGEWKDGTWRVVFKRAMKAEGEHHVSLSSDDQGLVPLALAVWNGEKGQRNGRKQLSAWRVLYLEDGEVDSAYLQQLAGLDSVQGNVETGKNLMTGKGCIACHAFPDNPVQPSTGPGLRYAGGIHHADYLLESLTEPSKVILPGKGFYTVQNGQRVSLMPPFQGSEQEQADIIAYLKTLQ